MFKKLLFPFLLLVFNTSLSFSQQTSKPNIIIILTDDAGYEDFGCYGSTEFKTPNIDKLAKNGVRCTQAYVSGTCCSPSRAGLMTGRYQNRFGHEFNLPRRANKGDDPELLGMDVNELTIADLLKKEGYYTGIVGKWHLGMKKKFHPMNRGFDEFFGFLHGSRSYFPTEKAEFMEPIYRGFEKAGEQPYLTEVFTTEAIDFVKRNKEKPFFLYLSYNAVHAPMDALPEDEKLYDSIEWTKRRKLAAMTHSLDREVGRFMNTLDSLQLTENTLIFFLNDNGGATISNGASNGKLNGQKGTVMEGGVRVPFIVHWPSKLKAKEYQHPITALDILPTSLAVAKGKLPKDRVYDGVNILSYLRGGNLSRPHQTFYWRYNNCAAVREGDWKLIRMPDRPAMLFNLARDEQELIDMAIDKPELVARLYKKLFEWEKSLPYPRWRSEVKWFEEDVKRYDKAYINGKARW
ncbi:sulfatase-like hydrolase/transferase [Flammeovirgaceae bacterium SG7u.111]|nr:sulfatase-like hydrolase/transferase [Flammeovirgaceae bacterium SG7u.132]WPO37896.1 sulfatase-like hydrolase/transferase [Flammeovirgaceae bacterium SG7u.111]